MEKNLKIFCDKIIELEQTLTDFVVVTLTGIKGSAPQEIGARMIVSNDGIIFGTVGGGKIEAHCIKTSVELLSENTQNKSYTWNLQRDIGMTCGGEVSFLFEPQKKNSNWNITIFGAGHVSQSLTRVLLNLDCQITVLDTRSEWLDKLPKADRLTKIHSANLSDSLNDIPDSSYVTLMTMGHASDVPILENALKNRNFPFLGVIGSKAKRNAMENELSQLGIDRERLSDFICPVGEKIGGNNPGEIAISIISQLLKTKDAILSNS